MTEFKRVLHTNVDKPMPKRQFKYDISQTRIHGIECYHALLLLNGALFGESIHLSHRGALNWVHRIYNEERNNKGDV